MSPGYDLWPSVSSVVPVFTLARTNASIEAAKLSGIAARRMRPDRVSRYFARFRLTLAWFVPRSITSTAPAIRIFPDFTGSKKLLSARKGISAWSTSTTPSSGSRSGSVIERRSFCASNQAVLYVMPSWASSWTADMPFEWVAMRCAAQNHTVSGNFDRASPSRPLSTSGDRSRGIRKCAPGSSTTRRVRRHRRGRQTPVANAARTRTPRNSSVGKARLKLAQRSRPSHACPLPPDADRRRTAPSYYILTNLGQRDEPHYKLCKEWGELNGESLMEKIVRKIISSSTIGAISFTDYYPDTF